MIGQTIGAKYVVLRLLGEGGMGAVYEAENRGTGRKVALKVVNDTAAKRAGAVERFMREAKVVGAVDTQHIVQIFDAGADTSTGCPYIAMELLAGEDVNQLVRRVGPLAPDLSLRIAAQACLGLAKAHAAGIIHRDIKPANLYLARRDGEVIVKLLDFGIAKTMTDEQSKMTATGSVLGSPSYMSPEQVKGLKTIDPRTDLWSLGAVMYEMLTGLVPYHQAETIHQLILKICAEAPPPLQDLSPWVPPEVVGAVEGAMQHDVARRFQSAVAMQDFIKRLLPSGNWSIHEGMLVPVDPRMRTTAAPRRGPSSALPGPTADSAAMGVSAAATTSAIDPPGDASRAPKPISLVPIAVAAAITIIAAAGVGVYKMTRHPANDVSLSASVSPTATASGPLVSVSTVHVRMPDGASVDVDGVSTPVANGQIEIAGKLGSSHRVRAAAGGREVFVDVVIADGGAVPDRIEFPAVPVASATASAPSPQAAAKGAPAPAHPNETKPPVQPPSAKPAKPANGVTTKFEL